MVKEPRPGRVKTRLGHDIGMVTAAWWFRHQSAAVLRRLRDPRWRIVLAVSPDHQGLISRVWPAMPRVPQGSGHLGRRMARVIARFPVSPVCVIGADIPGITRRHIARAFAALGHRDAVFGPADDGGYWLIGLRLGALARPRILDDVRWSGPHALEDSMSALRNWRIGLVDQLADVDDGEDLRRLQRR